MGGHTRAAIVALVITCVTVCHTGASGTGSIVADYRFENGLESSDPETTGGVPLLTALNTAAVKYEETEIDAKNMHFSTFGAGEGFEGTYPTVSTSYSVNIFAKLSNVNDATVLSWKGTAPSKKDVPEPSPWNSFVRTAGTELLFKSGDWFKDETKGANIKPNTWFNLLIIRDGETSKVSVFVNKRSVLEFDDNMKTKVLIAGAVEEVTGRFWSPDHVLDFFVDVNDKKRKEESAGSVSRIRVFKAPLSVAEAEGLDAAVAEPEKPPAEVPVPVVEPAAEAVVAAVPVVPTVPAVPVVPAVPTVPAVPAVPAVAAVVPVAAPGAAIVAEPAEPVEPEVAPPVEALPEPVLAWQGVYEHPDVKDVKTGPDFDSHVWTEAGAGGFTIITKLQAADSASQTWQDVFAQGGNGGFILSLKGGEWLLAKQSDPDEAKRAIGPAAEDGVPMYLAVTTNGEDVDFFVNGVSVKTTKSERVEYFNESGDLYIGGDPTQNNGGEKFKGKISRVSMYKGAMKPDDLYRVVVALEADNGAADSVGAVELPPNPFIVMKAEPADAAKDVREPAVKVSSTVKPSGCLALMQTTLPANMWGPSFTIVTRVKADVSTTRQDIIARSQCAGPYLGLENMQWVFGKQCHTDKIVLFKDVAPAVAGDMYTITLTYNGKTAVLFVDGVKAGELELEMTFENQGSVLVGCSNPDSFADKWTGHICALNVYDIVLDDGDIANESATLNAVMCPAIDGAMMMMM